MGLPSPPPSKLSLPWLHPHEASSGGVGVHSRDDASPVTLLWPPRGCTDGSERARKGHGHVPVWVLEGGAWVSDTPATAAETSPGPALKDKQCCKTVTS